MEVRERGDREERLEMTVVDVKKAVTGAVGA